MVSTPWRRKYGFTLNYGTPPQLLLDGKLTKSVKGYGWYGTAICWRTDERFRITSKQWFPVNTVLEPSHHSDTDRWIICKERTMALGGFTQDWLDEHEPGKGGDLQIPILF